MGSQLKLLWMVAAMYLGILWMPVLNRTRGKKNHLCVRQMISVCSTLEGDQMAFAYMLQKPASAVYNSVKTHYRMHERALSTFMSHR